MSVLHAGRVGGGGARVAFTNNRHIPYVKGDIKLPYTHCYAAAHNMHMKRFMRACLAVGQYLDKCV